MMGREEMGKGERECGGWGWEEEVVEAERDGEGGMSGGREVEVPVEKGPYRTGQDRPTPRHSPWAENGRLTEDRQGQGAGRPIHWKYSLPCQDRKKGRP